MNDTENKTYNGWANYETWAVKLWLDNTEGDYNYWREAAEECKASAANIKADHQYWSLEECAKFTLADRLKDELSEANPLAGDASMWADLMGAALSEVDWHEIADAFLEGLE